MEIPLASTHHTLWNPRTRLQTDRHTLLSPKVLQVGPKRQQLIRFAVACKRQSGPWTVRSLLGLGWLRCWWRSRREWRVGFSPYSAGARSSQSLLRSCFLLWTVAAWLSLYRLPAWASGMPAGPVAAVEGPLSARISQYSAVYGSLGIDLAVASLSLVIFGCCAGMETAITTLWPYKVRELALREEGTKGMWTALRRDLQRFLQTILIGATISGVLSTALVTEICGQLFGPRGLFIATVSLTVGQLVFAEIIPKSLAVSKPLPFATTFLPIFYGISKIVYPASRAINEVVKLFLKLFGVSVNTSKNALMSEEELDIIFRDAIESGLMDSEEGQMISSVRNLDVKKVKDVMTPLVDMTCIDSKEPISNLHKLWSETQFSRIPVYTRRFDSIVGVVTMKQLLKHVRNVGSEDEGFAPLQVLEICDKPFFVPETMTLLNSLRYLKERTLAICVDEYGGTTGLVTLEDVLEEIVGEIYDPDEEKDELEKQRNTSKITCIKPGHWSMAASAELEEVNSALSVKVPEGDYNSIGGFMCHVIDRIPVMGEAVVLVTSAAPVRLVVKDVDDRKVLKIEAFQDVVTTPLDEEEVQAESLADELVDGTTVTVLEVQTELVAVGPGTTADDVGSATVGIVTSESGGVTAVVTDASVTEKLDDGSLRAASSGLRGEDLFQELSALSPGVCKEDYFTSGTWDNQRLLDDLEAKKQDKLA
mmetsp:Transcript_11174/g.20322  ORF Transcript_11174/g.20322 Transcript_11174/m.20322 type:complete len:706 (+) Transcript_11174:11-2128(+)